MPNQLAHSKPSEMETRAWLRRPDTWVALWALYTLVVLAFFAREDALAGLVCLSR